MNRGEPNDRDLIGATLDGDEEAATALFRRYFDPLYAFVAWRVGRRRVDAEEVTQETFLDAWRSLASFDASRSFWAWLTGIARRKLARHCRSRARAASRISVLPELEEVAAAEDRGGLETLVQGERRLEIWRALAGLPPRQSRLLQAKYLDEKSLVQIGFELGIGPEAVSSGLQRARSALRRVIEDTEVGGRRDVI